MPALHEAYVSEIHHNLGYLGTWLPFQHLSLGDVGTIKDDEFHRVGSLRDFGISFVVRKAKPNSTYSYTSSGAVSVISKVAGHLLPGSNLSKNDLGLFIKFNRMHAIVFEAADCEIISMADALTIGRSVLQRYENGNWDRRHFVVTEVVTAGSTTIVISSGNQATIDLKVSSRIKSPLQSRAQIGAASEVVSSTNVGFKVVATSNLTPLFRAGGISSRYLGFGGHKFDTTTRGETISEPQSHFSSKFSQLGPADLYAAPTS